jgi:hypothetical protein
VAASWRDFLVTVAPIEGPNENVERRLLTGTKISVEPGAGADHFLGFGELPVDIIRKTNKPKGSLSEMDNEETLNTIAFLGGIGGARFIVSVVRQRPFFPTRRLQLVQCQLGDGTKVLDGDESGGKGALEVLCLDIKYSPNIQTPLRSIYAKTNGR